MVCSALGGGAVSQRQRQRQRPLSLPERQLGVLRAQDDLRSTAKGVPRLGDGARLVWGPLPGAGGGAPWHLAVSVGSRPPLALGLFFGSRRPPGMPFALSRPGLLAEPRRASAIWGCLGVWAITTGTNKPGDFWRGRFFWGEYHTRAEFVPQFHFDWAAVRGLF